MIDVVGSGFTVTVAGEEVAEQPPACVTVTENVPGAATLMDWVVSPLGDQSHDTPAFAVSVTLPP